MSSPGRSEMGLAGWFSLAYGVGAAPSGHRAATPGEPASPYAICSRRRWTTGLSPGRVIAEFRERSLGQQRQAAAESRAARSLKPSDSAMRVSVRTSPCRRASVLPPARARFKRSERSRATDDRPASREAASFKRSASAQLTSTRRPDTSSTISASAATTDRRSAPNDAARMTNSLLRASVRGAARERMECAFGEFIR